MRVQDKIVVVTGGAKGIGEALCHSFHRDGARHVIVADIDEAGAKATAAAVKGEAYRCDVTKEADIVALVTDVNSASGRSICSARTPASRPGSIRAPRMRPATATSCGISAGRCM
ncbi:MAG: SDR family NAD(P)-dependent oxidoreductase [Xanthobacteraceae bacterium]